MDLWKPDGWHESHATCCDGWVIDSVHDTSCHTTDGVYRCEECDLPFMRQSVAMRWCEFHRQAG